MKKIIMMAGLVITSLFLSCENSMDQVEKKPDISTLESIDKTELGKNAQFIEIARRNPQTGEMILDTDKLVKHMSNGVPVKYFGLRRTAQGYGFIRFGEDENGNHYSEAFQTSYQSGVVGLRLLDDLVWYVTCRISQCSFCVPNGDGSACDCPSGGGYDDDDLGGIKIYDPLGGTPSSAGAEYTTTGYVNCTLGAAGGGLYPNKVIF